MKAKKWIAIFGIFIGGSVIIAALVASIFALTPDELLKDEPVKIKPIAVKLAEPAKQEAPPEPPAKAADANLLASLAPDSFSGAQDVGGGVGFGSGGFGPGIGGGGGFGTDAGQLVKDKTSINRPPRLAMKGTLEYPSEARQRSISGYVTLKILVGASGLVETIEVEESEPKGTFDQAAMKSVKTWKFEPAVVKGQTVAAWTSQRIKFELN
jgi:periplasmic protein TonB